MPFPGAFAPKAQNSRAKSSIFESMISTILIIGAGQAGSQAVDTLRREGFAGRLALIGEEPELPYQRPPLSKKYLSGELAPERLLLRHRSFYDEHQTELLLGSRVA